MKKTIVTIIITVLIITVGVMGFLLWQTNKKQTQNSEVNPIAIDTINNTGLDDAKPKVIDNSDNLNDDTVQTTTQKNANNDQDKNNFKKFIDKDFGISFEHPEECKISKHHMEHAIYNQQNRYADVDIIFCTSYSNDDVKKLKGFSISKSKENIIFPNGAKDSQIEDEFINGIRYQKFKMEGVGEPYGYYTRQGNWYYTFEITFAPEDSEEAQVFENIIKSVKFLK